MLCAAQLSGGAQRESPSQHQIWSAGAALLLEDQSLNWRCSEMGSGDANFVSPTKTTACTANQNLLQTDAMQAWRNTQQRSSIYILHLYLPICVKEFGLFARRARSFGICFTRPKTSWEDRKRGEHVPKAGHKPAASHSHLSHSPTCPCIALFARHRLAAVSNVRSLSATRRNLVIVHGRES